MEREVQKEGISFSLYTCSTESCQSKCRVLEVLEQSQLPQLIRGKTCQRVSSREGGCVLLVLASSSSKKTRQGAEGVETTVVGGRIRLAKAGLETGEQTEMRHNE